VDRWIGDAGEFHALGQKPYASVYFAQTFFAVDVVSVFRPIAIARRPMHDLKHFGSFIINEA